LATKVFDIAINCGPSTAIRIVQKAINSIRQADKDITLISVDGKMGKVTLESINALDSDPLLSAIVFFQKTYYRDLCERNGKLSVFLKGWLKRADNI
jgi:lysozyme family protein